MGCGCKKRKAEAAQKAAQSSKPLTKSSGSKSNDNTEKKKLIDKLFSIKI